MECEVGQRDYVRIMPTDGKGLGLFATQHITKGTRIIEEQPLVMLPPNEAHSRFLWEQFSKMSEAQLKEYCSLSFCENIVTSEQKRMIYIRLSRTHRGRELECAMAEEIKMQSIFHTNCVAMGTNSQFGIGVFPFYSRINHSCTPNVHNSYNPTLQREVVHATADISTGEEILTSYTANARGVDELLDFTGSIPRNATALALAIENISLLVKEGLQGMDLAVGYASKILPLSSSAYHLISYRDCAIEDEQRSSGGSNAISQGGKSE
ncbi:Hypothetical protein R9X50_00534000 [Acrodontium crateriforme]|uniref:SET domain-containing protein n=1 Tax=Acrodontium crateriforme TaxID=150365 RepID=A0AAQ3RAS9_9PEZI|nr:Hypothetical protein R9X50_00534000 [Acrodontium crateriforme]